MTFYLPIGTIICYSAPSETSLPSNWRICNGNGLNTTTYAKLFKIIGISNGGSGSEFKLPNFQGRFARGNVPAKLNYLDAPVIAPGATGSFSTARNPNVKVRLESMPEKTHKTVSGGANTRNMIKGVQDSTKFTVGGGDSESRPVNISLYYIIKVADASDPLPSPLGPGINGLPLASVIPFGGKDSVNPGNYPDWMRCNGSTISSNQVPALYNLVGKKYLVDQSSSTNFQAPNIAGKFIRGIDMGAIIDKDPRNPAPDSSTPGVGSWQGYATCYPEASFEIKHWCTDAHNTTVASGNDNLGDYNPRSDYSIVGEGNSPESRPLNAAVQFYTNSVTGKDTDFPIGGIIGITGTLATDAIWLECNGASLARTETDANGNKVDKQLFTVIGTVWGTQNNDTFNLPDLRGRFLRGTDLDGAPNGDPDRSNRSVCNTGGSKSGTGSVQSYATGKARTTPQLKITYPSDVYSNWDGGSNHTASVGRVKEFPMSFTGSYETAPASLYMKWYIRAV